MNKTRIQPDAIIYYISMNIDIVIFLKSRTMKKRLKNSKKRRKPMKSYQMRCFRQ